MWVPIVYCRPAQGTHRWLVKPDTSPHCLQEGLGLLMDLLLHVVVVPTLQKANDAYSTHNI